MAKVKTKNEIVEHYLNGFAEECPNVLLNRADYNILKKKCEKMLLETEAKDCKCTQHIGTIEDCENEATICYQCYLKKITEFEKAVRNDECKATEKRVYDKVDVIINKILVEYPVENGTYDQEITIKRIKQKLEQVKKDV
jgi:hypothetical protein